VQNGPCVGPILAAPMSQGGQLPDKAIVIVGIKLIIVMGTKNILSIFLLNGYYLH
jgi:hypothetical protein